MVQGFNHNIRHKGKLYHVQTEDSGKENPHIITHVFVGGNILASKKTSYADIVKADRLEEIVRELMEEQHKSVLRNLINGVYDNAAPEPAGDVKELPTPETPAKPEPPVATVVTTPPGAVAAPKPKPPQPAAPQPQPATVVAAVRPTPRPANPPPQPSKERSLDEIILAYLADRDE